MKGRKNLLLFLEATFYKAEAILLHQIYIYIYMLGSKNLGTKCIRTSFRICWQTMIKTMSLGLGLPKIYLLV